MKSIKLIIVALMLTLSTSLFAGLGTDAVSNAGFSDLTEQQQAEIIKTITDKKAEASQVAQTSAVDEAQKWVNLGASIGKGLAGSARELGMAVNDFAATDAGKLTTALIVWNIMGDDAMDLFGGLMFIIVGLSALTYMFRRTYPTTYYYHDNGKVSRKETAKPSSDAVGGWVFTYLVVIAIGCLVIVV